jgi:hypothetical protein
VLILFQSINWLTDFQTLEFSSTMKMEADISFETLTSTYDFTRYHELEVYKNCPLVQALRPCTGRTAHRVSRGIALLFLDHGTRRRSASPPGRCLPPLYTRLGGSQGRSGHVWKLSLPLGFDPRTVQPVASRYTDWATRPTEVSELELISMLLINTQFITKMCISLIIKEFDVFGSVHLCIVQ